MRTQRSIAAALPILGLVAFPLVVPLRAADQASKSAPVAQELTKQLDTSKLQHIAARDPNDPTRFFAVMYMPGVQIVAVSGTYAAPILLNEKLLQKKYQDIYIDLSSASDRNSRQTFEDLRADGFPAGKLKNQPGDTFEHAGQRVIFDFDWKKQKLSEKDFLDKLATADAEYARILNLLLAELKK